MATSSPHSLHGLESARAWLENRDHRLMRRVNRWQAPRWMRLWMIAATRGGDGLLWLGMGLVVALFGEGDRVRALLAAGLSASLGILLFLKLKRHFRRRRPMLLEPHCWVTLLPPDQFSFPSGHSITAFAVAGALAPFYPAMAPGLYFCAASVAASRVLLGMHFLTDVLAGVTLGALLGAGAFHAMQWI